MMVLEAILQQIPVRCQRGQLFPKKYCVGIKRKFENICLVSEIQQVNKCGIHITSH